MPSISKKQQALFGMALSYKRGECKDCSDKIKQLANSLSEEELEKFAKLQENDMEDNTLEVNEGEKKISDKPVDIKVPKPIENSTPEVPPGYVKADKRKDPGFFTPSLFKRPGDKTAKHETRVMDFEEFLKRINYRTHDGMIQDGKGKNLTTKGGLSIM